MIAGMLKAPRRAVDPGRDQAASNRRAQQQMIDAQPGIAGKRVPEILPEGVDPLVRIERAQRVGPPMSGQPAKGFAHFRPEQRVIDPTLRRVHVELGRHHIVIAGQHDGRAAREQAARMFLQPFEPAQLVMNFGPGAGLPFGR